MTIITKPATEEYRNNFDTIFKKEVTMKRYRVPVDLFVYADTAEEVEKKAYRFMDMAARDHGPTFNLSGFIFPVDYPTEPDQLGSPVDK